MAVVTPMLTTLALAFAVGLRGCLFGVATIVAVIRADKRDLVRMIQAMMRFHPPRPGEGTDRSLPQ
jgi:uncharacterized membrane protein HdeD (DUF308 family)